MASVQQQDQPKHDPFNWPPMQRCDLMSRTALSFEKDNMNMKTPVMMKLQSKKRMVSQNLDTDDILGAKPKVWAAPEINKPEFINCNYDIEGSGPRMLHVQLNKPEYNLTNKDIQGTWPQWNKFITKREASNPLEPKYKLASFEYVPPEPVPFRRDQMTVDDIAGAKAMHSKLNIQRQTLKTADIPGAMPRQPYNRKSEHRYIDYTDVTNTKWISQRRTNPLMPSYSVVDDSSGHFTQVRKMMGLNTQYGGIEGSRPATQPRARQDPGRTMNTADISGAQADSKNCGAFTWMKRRQVRAICTNDDIEGSKADTLKKCATTKRNCDPLNPDYQLPGHSEGFSLMNDPYAMNMSSMGPANFKKAQFEGVKRMMSAASEKIIPKVASEKSVVSGGEAKAASEKKSEQQSAKQIERKSEQRSVQGNIEKPMSIASQPKEAQTQDKENVAANCARSQKSYASRPYSAAGSQQKPSPITNCWVGQAPAMPNATQSVKSGSMRSQQQLPPAGPLSEARLRALEKQSQASAKLNGSVHSRRSGSVYQNAAGVPSNASHKSGPRSITSSKRGLSAAQKLDKYIH